MGDMADDLERDAFSSPWVQEEESGAMTREDAEKLAAYYEALGYETEIIAYNHTATETRYRVEYWPARGR